MTMTEATEHRRVTRRRWHRPGRYDSAGCQDCGRRRPWTVITFWTTGYRYRVCGDCIRPYRRVILRPCSCEAQP